ncbi:MAG: DRTGG domain-containing protein [Eubacteriales bacterium]
MKISDLVKELEAEVKCCGDTLDREVSWCYCSDLLSDVMANAAKDSVWVTLQTHPNIVAVASLLGLSAVLIIRGATPDPETIEKAIQENIPILTTKLPTFETAGRIFNLLSKKV